MPLQPFSLLGKYLTTNEFESRVASGDFGKKTSCLHDMLVVCRVDQFLPEICDVVLLHDTIGVVVIIIFVVDIRS
jgi:hypothetical protein